jgi:hypothetical protein
VEHVKIFIISDSGSAVESEMNAWFERMGDKIEITHRQQSSAAAPGFGFTTILIFYKNK